MTDLAYCKGKAFSDSSVEEMERAIESNLEARGLNDSEHNYGKKSDNSEMQASLDSDLNYWQEFNPFSKKHMDRKRTVEARQNKKGHFKKQEQIMKRQKAMRDREDVSEQIKQLKKEH